MRLHLLRAGALAALVLLAGCDARSLALWGSRAGEPPARAATGPAAAYGRPVEAAVTLPDGRVLVAEAAAGAMPAVRRPVALLARAGAGWQVAALAELALPGKDLQITQQDLPGHPGALVLAARLDRGEPRYAALAVRDDRLEVLDYYTLTAPAPEVRQGVFLYVNKHLNQLWLFKDGQLVRTFPVATGRQTAGPAPTAADYQTNTFTPEGRFTIDLKQVNPRYYGDAEHPPAEPGAANNPLGTRWLGFKVLPAGDPGTIWGIHGTHEPERLGMWVSNGCIRMATPDVEALYPLVPEKAVLRVASGRT